MEEANVMSEEYGDGESRQNWRKSRYRKKRKIKLEEEARESG